MAFDRDVADLHPKIQGLASQIKELGNAPSAETIGPVAPDGTQLWFTVNPDGELDAATAHAQEEGAKAQLVAAKSRREVQVCQWHEFEAYGWTCKQFILTPFTRSFDGTTQQVAVLPILYGE